MKRILTALCLVLLPVAVQAEKVLLDRIVAVVNNDVVLQSELDARVLDIQQRYRDNPAVLPPRTELANQILDALILEQVQVQKAAEVGITITDAALNSALTDIAARQGMDLLAFRNALAREGLSYDNVRRQVRRDMLIRQAQQRFVARQVQVSDAEVNQYLQTQVSAALQDVEYRLQHLLIAHADSAAETTARSIADTVNTSSQTLQAAAVGRTVQDLGWRRAESLPSLLREPVRGLSTGSARVFESPNGWHVVFMAEQRGSATQAVTEYLTRHILINETRGLTATAAAEFAQDLYQQLTEEGADFADLAERYSVDNSAQDGGNLGWNPAEVFVPEFAEAVRNTPKDQISAPFRTTFGWHILQVQERRETDQSLTALRDKARELLFEQKYSEALPRWQQEIKNGAYISLRNEP
ncbi:MAG: peptidylprolyl isomerase [Natronospirillum sp.]